MLHGFSGSGGSAVRSCGSATLVSPGCMQYALQIQQFYTYNRIRTPPLSPSAEINVTVRNHGAYNDNTGGAGYRQLFRGLVELSTIGCMVME